MQKPNALSTAVEPFDSPAGTLKVPAEDAPGNEPPPVESSAGAATKTTPVQIVLIVLGTIAFLYFARPVILPVFLACVAGMALKPLIRWSSCCHIPPALSAAVVLCLLVAAVGIGFFQLGRPALTWMNEAPQHMTDLRQRVLNIFPRLARFSQAAAAVNNLGATEEEKKKRNKRRRPRWRSRTAVAPVPSLTGPAPSWWALARRWCWFTCC